MGRVIGLILVVSLQGCMTYTAANAGVIATTGKGLVDHTATAVVPNSNCDLMNLAKGLYYCEIRDVSTTYNRNSF